MYKVMYDVYVEEILESLDQSAVQKSQGLHISHLVMDEAQSRKCQFELQASVCNYLRKVAIHLITCCK